MVDRSLVSCISYTMLFWESPRFQGRLLPSPIEARGPWRVPTSRASSCRMAELPRFQGRLPSPIEAQDPCPSCTSGATQTANQQGGCRGNKRRKMTARCWKSHARGGHKDIASEHANPRAPPIDKPFPDRTSRADQHSAPFSLILVARAFVASIVLRCFFAASIVLRCFDCVDWNDLV